MLLVAIALALCLSMPSDTDVACGHCFSPVFEYAE